MWQPCSQRSSCQVLCNILYISYLVPMLFDKAHLQGQWRCQGSHSRGASAAGVETGISELHNMASRVVVFEIADRPLPGDFQLFRYFCSRRDRLMTLSLASISSASISWRLVFSTSIASIFVSSVSGGIVATLSLDRICATTRCQPSYQHPSDLSRGSVRTQSRRVLEGLAFFKSRVFVENC